ncbi:hypothetical protein TNCV_3822171 [Trichonephila clavipes]|nr:hypothetical protein TNCV_3822171 [Trichonephila clavipes]
MTSGVTTNNRKRNHSIYNGDISTHLGRKIQSPTVIRKGDVDGFFQHAVSLLLELKELDVSINAQRYTQTLD